jgi:hypothetical protein
MPAILEMLSVSQSRPGDTGALLAVYRRHGLDQARGTYLHLRSSIGFSIIQSGQTRSQASRQFGMSSRDVPSPDEMDVLERNAVDMRRAFRGTGEAPPTPEERRMYRRPGRH